MARILTDKLYSLLGQQIVVVNKTGGGGAVGIKAAKDAAADGYTVLIAPPPLVQIPLARKDIGFTYKDFTPINLAAKFYFVMVIKKDAPWKGLEEIIAGFLMRKTGFEGAPFILALVLGPIMETSLRQSLIISRGSFAIFFSRPVTAVLLLLSVTFLLTSLIPAFKTKREKLAAEMGG